VRARSNNNTLQGLSGDCTDATVLLHSLAEVYASTGEPAMAAGLLRRAAIHWARPVSATHADAVLRARLALAELVAASKAPPEEAAALRRAVAEDAEAAAAQARRLGVAAAVVDSLAGTARAAAR
jgi:hypothetical protein